MTMEDDEVYATADDLEARWQPLTPDERTKAAALLADASDLMRTEAGSLTGVPSSTLKRVACAVVKRAMVRDRADGAVSHSQTVGPVSESFTYAQNSGNLGGMWLTDEDKRALGIGRSRAFSVDLSGGADD